MATTNITDVFSRLTSPIVVNIQATTNTRPARRTISWLSGIRYATATADRNEPTPKVTERGRSAKVKFDTCDCSSTGRPGAIIAASGVARLATRTDRAPSTSRVRFNKVEKRRLASAGSRWHSSRENSTTTIECVIPSPLA